MIRYTITHVIIVEFIFHLIRRNVIRILCFINFNRVYSTRARTLFGIIFNNSATMRHALRKLKLNQARLNGYDNF